MRSATYRERGKSLCRQKGYSIGRTAGPAVELAAAFLIANQLAFSGITKAGIAGDYERRWNYKKVADRIYRIAAYKNRITVMHMDALQVIEEFYWNADHFLFIDPPYVLQGKQLYREWYETDDHKRLQD